MVSPEALKLNEILRNAQRPWIWISHTNERRTSTPRT
jgi:hypothetical protein